MTGGWCVCGCGSWVRRPPSSRDWLFSVAPLSLWEPLPAINVLLGMTLFGMLRAMVIS